MKNSKAGIGPPLKPTVALISRALNAAVQEAIEVHRKAGLPLAVWRNGRVEWIDADSITLTKRRRAKKPPTT